MSAIVINNLSKRQGKQEVLSDLNLEVLDGEIFSLLGLKNSGKTTLARILMGYLKSNKNNVKIYDMDSFKESKEIKEITSFVPEDTLLNSNAKCSSILKKTLNAHNLQNTEDIDNICDYFNFDYSFRISDLEPRELKLFAIINAFITKPRLLILDNPCTNLNRGDIDKLFSYVKNLNETEGLTVFILTDSLKEARKYSTRIAYLHDGKIADVEYNNISASGDKVLRIKEYRGNLNYFTSIGARVIKDADEETILYYDKSLPELSKVIYEETLNNYILEDATLEDKISAYYSGDNLSTRAPKKEPQVNKEKLETKTLTETLLNDSVEKPDQNISLDEESTTSINTENTDFTLGEDKKDKIHNTQTNLFVDEPVVEEKDIENSTDVNSSIDASEKELLDSSSQENKETFDDLNKDLDDSSQETKTYTNILSSDNVDYAKNDSTDTPNKDKGGQKWFLTWNLNLISQKLLHGPLF